MLLVEVLEVAAIEAQVVPEVPATEAADLGVVAIEVLAEADLQGHPVHQEEEVEVAEDTKIPLHLLY